MQVLFQDGDSTVAFESREELPLANGSAETDIAEDSEAHPTGSGNVSVKPPAYEEPVEENGPVAAAHEAEPVTETPGIVG